MANDPSAGRPTPHLDSLAESMHAHRKKTLFFIECLHDHALVLGRPTPQELRVLELGCGNGTIVTLPVAEQRFVVTGVDLREPSIASARAHRADTTAIFVCVDATAFENSTMVRRGDPLGRARARP